MRNAVRIELHALGRILRQQRIIDADLLDEAAVTGISAVGHDDPVIGQLLGAPARETNCNCHSNFLSFRHSRESGSPFISNWIPAFAGMTGQRARHFLENLSKPGGRLNGDPPRPGRAADPPPPRPGKPPAPPPPKPPRPPPPPPNLAASLPTPSIFFSRCITDDISWCIFSSFLIS